MIWTIIEWTGVAISLTGAALVAGKTAQWRRWGFGLWVASNLLLIAFAVHQAAMGLATMYAVFLVTSGMGWWNNRTEVTS